jgi:ribose-phosphate pyrophosphokinase
VRLLLAFPAMERMANDLGHLLGQEIALVNLHKFPDGESLVSLPEDLHGRDVAIVATLRDPDALAIPLWFAAQTARELGAERVGLVAPYLAYMRQDRRFEPGQAVSAPLFARFLGQAFDWLVTADPHLHRVASLRDIFPMSAEHVATAPLLADWIAQEVANPVVIGPDSESAQWVAEVARLAGCPYEVLHKQRTGDRSVAVSAPRSDTLEGRTPVLVDDIASSGRTMVEATRQLLAQGTAAPVCVVIHPLFAAGAYEEILASGSRTVVSTDSISHPSNAISLAPILAPAIERHGQEMKS